MAEGREVCVHQAPRLGRDGRLAGGVAVVIDVLRATTTIVHALAAGCVDVRPCAEVDEARGLAASIPDGRALLGGERDGKPLPGFDVGNSPLEYTEERCLGRVLVLTTSNGTRALLRAAEAARVLVAGFVNFSAVCEQLRREARPVHVVCAGDAGGLAPEDDLLAGAIVDFLARLGPARPDDGARSALAGFERCGGALEEALAGCPGAARLRGLGYGEDVRAAARVDRLALAPELRRDPVRVTAGSSEGVPNHWRPR